MGKKLAFFGAILIAGIVGGRGLVFLFIENSTFEVEAQSEVVREQAIFANFDVASTSFVFCDSGGAPAGIQCSTGSAVEDGWVTVAGESNRSVQINIDTINATSLDFIIQGRNRGQTVAAQIWPATGDRAETTTGSFIVQVPDSIYELRVGVKVDTDTGAQNVDGILNTFAPDQR
jgi:hypothetical protein